MWAYRMDERWIQSWGYWRSAAQYLTYVRKFYGRHPFVAGIVAFGFDLQGGRPFDFVGAQPSTAGAARATTGGGLLGGRTTSPVLRPGGSGTPLNGGQTGDQLALRLR